MRLNRTPFRYCFVKCSATEWQISHVIVRPSRQGSTSLHSRHPPYHLGLMPESRIRHQSGSRNVLLWITKSSLCTLASFNSEVVGHAVLSLLRSGSWMACVGRWNSPHVAGHCSPSTVNFKLHCTAWVSIGYVIQVSPYCLLFLRSSQSGVRVYWCPIVLSERDMIILHRLQLELLGGDSTFSSPCSRSPFWPVTVRLGFRWVSAMVTTTVRSGSALYMDKYNQ